MYFVQYENILLAMATDDWKHIGRFDMSCAQAHWVGPLSCATKTS